MKRDKLTVINGTVKSDSINVSDFTGILETRITFDVDEVAANIGVTPQALAGRMLDMLARAFIIDAIAFANDEMRARGQRLGVDGFPDDWPQLHVSAVVMNRLFPELAQ